MVLTTLLTVRDVVLMGPQHIRQYHTRAMINGMTEPSLLRFLLNKAPHLINFHFFHFLDFHDDLIGLHLLDG